LKKISGWFEHLMINKKYTAFIIGLISFIVVFINLFPNWYAWKNTPEGYVFTGQASWFDPWDINNYVSAIRWGQDRGLLIENVYDSVENKPIFYYPLYTVGGRIFQNSNPFVVFYLLSIFTSVILITFLVLVLKKFFKRPIVLILTTLAIALGGGLGFLVFPTYESLDTHMTSITLFSSFQRAHEGFALTAYLLALFGFYLSVTTGSKKWRLLTVIGLVVTLLFYPYHFLSFLLISAVFYFLSFRKISKKDFSFLISVIFFGLIVTGFMFYNLFLSSSFVGITGQSLSKPKLTPFLLGYGILLIPYLYQLFVTRRTQFFKSFLLIWISVGIILCLIPVGFSRFFLRGVYVPLVIVAVFTIKEFCQKYFSKEHFKVFVVFLNYLLVFLSITSCFIFYHRLRESYKQNDWYYMTQFEHEALIKMEKSYSNPSSILSSYYMGNLIPAHTKHRVYLGHLIQTPNADKRLVRLANFYTQEMSDNEAKEFLQEAQIDLIFYRKEEKELLQLINQDQTDLSNNLELNYSFLEEVFSNDEVSIYQNRWH
jgi:hypothetical protein